MKKKEAEKELLSKLDKILIPIIENRLIFRGNSLRDFQASWPIENVIVNDKRKDKAENDNQGE